MNPPPEFRNSDSSLFRPTPTRTVDFGLLFLRRRHRPLLPKLLAGPERLSAAPWRRGTSASSRSAPLQPGLEPQPGHPADPTEVHTLAVYARAGPVLAQMHRPGTQSFARRQPIVNGAGAIHCVGRFSRSQPTAAAVPRELEAGRGWSPLRGQCLASGALSLSAGGVCAGSNFGVSHLIERPKVEGREESFVPEAEKGYLEMENSGTGRVKWTVQLQQGISCPLGWNGEDNGAPLQYSCLENPMDGGAWWAAVSGVAESRTRLSDFAFTFRFHTLEKEMATHSSVLAWRIPGTGEPDGLPSMGSHRVGHD